MVVKKKTAASVEKPVASAVSGSLEEAVAKEEKRPVVTQVVEVVEEAPPAPVVPPSPPPVTNDGIEHTPPLPQAPEEAAEKKKEVVDELFQKKNPELSQMMPEISVHSNRSTPVYLWAIGIIVACLVIGIGLLFVARKGGSLPSVVVIPTPTATPAPKTTPTASVSATTRSAITVQVLNGGGKAGAASKMKAFLEGKGYTVGDTGNTESYNYTKTEILVKASKKTYSSLLENDLKEAYTLGTSSATLDESASYDARVIVGKE